MKNLKVLVLAAGLGTRLRPLTDHYAKPSLPVLGIPTLWYSVWLASKCLGVKQVAMNYSHAPESLLEAANDNIFVKNIGINFKFSDERSQILGSSGALKKVSSWVKDDLLVVLNADAICEYDIEKLVSAHHKSRAQMTLLLRPVESEDESFTDIQFQKTNKGECRVQSLGEKKKAGTMFSGIYCIDGKLLSQLPEGASELRKTLLEPLVDQNKLNAVVDDFRWYDTGTIYSYIDTQLKIAANPKFFSELIHLKMKNVSIEKCQWLPNDWKNKINFDHKNIILTGSENFWLTNQKQIGDEFIGFQKDCDGLSQTKILTNGLFFDGRFFPYIKHS